MEGSKKIQWEALDYIKEENSSDWYWIVGIVAIGIALTSIYFSNILFAIVILLGVFTIFIQNHEPKIEKYAISRRGVIIGNKLFPYSTLESFYVIDEDGWDRDRLLIKSNKLFAPLLILPLGEDVTPDEIREYLIEYLDEEEMEESAIEKIIVNLGF